MKCPLLKNDLFIDGEWFSRKASDCLKEECALWDKSKQWCVICELSAIGDNLQYFLKAIGDKMPSPEFFKK